MLVAAHQRLHRAFLDLWEEALVAMTELDFGRARHFWYLFSANIDAHRKVEESFVPDWPEEPAPRGGSQELVLAEHARLDLLITEALAHIDHLETFAEDFRRKALVRNLDPFLRVRHLIEHHAEREDRLIYPRLELALSNDQLSLMVSRLEGASK
jgi:hypothetical protein